MAARFELHSFARLNSGAEAPLDQAGVSISHLVERFRDKTVQIGGTFVATVDVEATLDGSTWSQIASNTGPALVSIPQAVRLIRINITAYTSGTVLATFGGFDQRIDH